MPDGTFPEMNWIYQTYPSGKRSHKNFKGNWMNVLSVSKSTNPDFYCLLNQLAIARGFVSMQKGDTFPRRHRSTASRDAPRCGTEAFSVVFCSSSGAKSCNSETTVATAVHGTSKSFEQQLVAEVASSFCHN